MADKDKKDIDNALESLLAKTEVPAAEKVAAEKPVAKAAEVDKPVSIELTEREKAELTKEATAEVAKELKDKKRKEFKEAAKQRLKQQQLFQHGKDEEGEDTETVVINLASHSPFIRLDHNIYYHGMVYRLNKEKAAVVKDTMWRTWLHDAEINGLDMNSFLGRQKIHAVLSPTAVH